MPDDLRYRSPLRATVDVQDRWGGTLGVLINDGSRFFLEFRGNRFEGDSPDALELVQELEHSLQPPDLDGRDLCGYRMTWTMPLPVSVDQGDPENLPLTIALTVPDPAHPDTVFQPYGVTMELELADGTVVRSEHAPDVDQALRALQQKTSASTLIRSCTSCALSDYHPVGYGFMGNLACFRNRRSEFRAAVSKFDLMALWGDRAGYVQETFSCADYE